MSFNNPAMNLTGKTQRDTYQGLVQVSSSVLVDGLGNSIPFVDITASYVVNGSSGSIGTVLNTGSTYPITSSNAVSASWAPSSGGGTVLNTGSTYPITSSWSNNTVSSSYALTASFALNGGNGGTTLTTASTYQITSSWAVSSSYSSTSSFALNAGTTLTTASTYQITSSNTISASWANKAGAAISASWASASFSAVSASWASSSFASVSSSYASRSLSSSYALSASYASGISASYANTASWALNVVNLPTSNAIVTSSVNISSASYDNTNPSVTVMTYTIPSTGMYRMSAMALGSGDTDSQFTMIYYHMGFVDEHGAVSHTDFQFRLQIGITDDCTPSERTQYTYCFSAINGTSFSLSWDTAAFISGGSPVTGALQIITKATLEKLI